MSPPPSVVRARRDRDLRVLFLSDTHLGFDLPRRPRVVRRRRGEEFFANFERALRPARDGEADLVVHGGDLFFRSRVSLDVAQRGFRMLAELPDRSVPVVVVPGNHERSSLPFRMLMSRPGVHVLDRPRTVELDAGGVRVAVSGFPYLRRARQEFSPRLEETEWRRVPADVRLLCLHQAVEGGRVGAHDYTFRRGDDVIRGADIPGGFAAVLSGHLHRAQILRSDLSGRRLRAPVVFAGSIDRTSFAERRERKGYMTLRLRPGSESGGRLAAWRFHELPTRPMFEAEVEGTGLTGAGLLERMERRLRALPPEAIVRLRVRGRPSPGALPGAEALRRITPETMNVTLAWRDLSDG